MPSHVRVSSRSAMASDLLKLVGDKDGDPIDHGGLFARIQA